MDFLFRNSNGQNTQIGITLVRWFSRNFQGKEENYQIWINMEQISETEMKI